MGARGDRAGAIDRQMFEQRGLYAVLSLVVNILRSVPFVILLILMIPLTVLITGT